MFLYIKEHNQTGLKYFGQTHTKDPYKYKGSGKYWKSHLAKHGLDIATKKVWEFSDDKKAKTFALEFSKDNNIVESNEWANLILEDGTQGASIGNQNATGNKGKSKTQQHKDKIAKAKIGKQRKDLIGNKFATALKGRKKTAEHQANINARLNDPEVKAKVKLTRSLRPIVKCPHCAVTGKQGHNMKRYHFDNCKKI